MSSIDQNIFTEEFLKIDPASVGRAIVDQGYFSFARAVKPEFLEKLNAEIRQYKPGANLNTVAPVWFNEQYFFPHAMATSKSYFDYITSPFLRTVSAVKFPNGFRLKCHRYYETRHGHSMEWHADNVTNDGKVTGVDGLIFILYVNDVFDGEFQLVLGSYEERRQGQWTYNYTNDYIEKNYASRVKSFAMPAGSIVVYDTYGIHRAKPIVTNGYTRKSIFFQVDSDERFAEQIYLNPAFFDSNDPDLLQYLGFGKKHDYLANPVATINDMPAPQLLRFMAEVVAAMIYRFRYGLFHSLLTHDQRMKWVRWRRETLIAFNSKYPQAYRALNWFKRKVA